MWAPARTGICPASTAACGSCPPFGYAERGGEYRGNMDALAGVADYLENIRQDYVILAWGDMAVNLPVAEVFQQHLDSGADVTMVCTPSLEGRAPLLRVCGGG